METQKRKWKERVAQYRTEGIIGFTSLCFAVYFLIAFLREGRMSGRLDTDQTRPVIGRIAHVDKSVRHRTPRMMDWNTAEAGISVRRGDSVFTGDQSTATVQFADGGRLDLSANTLVVFSSFETSRFDLRLGNFRLKVDGPMEVSVQGKPLTIEGTSSEVQIYVPKDEEPIVRLLKGTAKLKQVNSASVNLKPDVVQEIRRLPKAESMNTVATALPTASPTPVAPPVIEQTLEPAPAVTEVVSPQIDEAVSIAVAEPEPPPLVVKPSPVRRHDLKTSPKKVPLYEGVDGVRATVTPASAIEMVDAGKYGKVHIEWAKDERDLGQYQVIIKDKATAQEQIFEANGPSFEFSASSFVSEVSIKAKRLSVPRKIANDARDAVPPIKVEISPPDKLGLSQTTFPAQNQVLILNKDSRISLPLRQREVAGAVEYRFEISKDSEFKKVITKLSSSTPSKTLKGKISPGRYYVRTQAFTPSGYANWSEPVQFEVVKP